MEYQLFLLASGFVRFSSRFVFFLLVLSGLLISNAANAQTSYWAVSADIGTSLQKAKDDTLTRQGLLLPSYGASLAFGKVLSQGLDLKVGLGYRSRGGVTKVDAVISANDETTLGSYKIRSRDHFLTNDLSFQFNSSYWRVLDLLPFASLGLRNDLYLFSNTKTISKDSYFKPEESGQTWHRNRHYRPFVVGLVGTIGVRLEEDWRVGLEYYHQIFGSYQIPALVRANYSQLLTRSLQVSVTYRF
ncbi:hypothetical protein GCM10023091_43770 [Ravibacter arvi]|uniref:Outer membrane protein beta-barrel domain-containing protein n=1 Tax=Ravibacter arvi TaxID=2051041 RepID=A0ABP8MFB4_9BACT